MKTLLEYLVKSHTIKSKTITLKDVMDFFGTPSSSLDDKIHICGQYAKYVLDSSTKLVLGTKLQSFTKFCMDFLDIELSDWEIDSNKYNDKIKLKFSNYIMYLDGLSKGTGYEFGEYLNELTQR